MTELKDRWIDSNSGTGVDLAPSSIPNKSRAGRDAGATRRDILHAAMQEFAEYGDAGARIDRIARLAGANKSLIYSYFGNKQELYARVLHEAYLQIRAGERELKLDQLDPREAIRALMKFTMEHYLRAPWFLRLLATENLRRGETIRNIEQISDLQSPLIAQLTEVLNRGSAQGVFRNDVSSIELYVMMASLFYFPISNSHTLSVVFDAQVGQASWRDNYLNCAQEMVVSYLETTLSPLSREA